MSTSVAWNRSGAVGRSRVVRHPREEVAVDQVQRGSSFDSPAKATSVLVRLQRSPRRALRRHASNAREIGQRRARGVTEPGPTTISTSTMASGSAASAKARRADLGRREQARHGGLVNRASPRPDVDLERSARCGVARLVSAIGVLQRPAPRQRAPTSPPFPTPLESTRRRDRSTATSTTSTTSPRAAPAVIGAITAASSCTTTRGSWSTTTRRPGHRLGVGARRARLRR